MKLSPNFRLWIYSDTGMGVFGDGKVRLLKAIAECGSLREAARTLDISYRKAWEDLKRAEACLDTPLVHRTRGGRDGGKMSLTEPGERVVAGYEDFRKAVEQSVTEQFALFQRNMQS